jgi:hypothetical protein
VPILAGDAGVVEFAGEDFEGLAIESEMISIGAEGARLLGRKKIRGGEEGTAEKNSFHLCGRDIEIETRVTLVHLRECFKGESNFNCFVCCL